MDLVKKKVDELYKPFVRSGALDPYHSVLQTFCQLCNEQSDINLLEVGSREVSGVSRRGLFRTAKNHVGFDIHAGPGVDVAGDAHVLSNYFEPASFDAVFSISVFEHLAFPWKVVLEINKLLKVGGYCYISTHPVWPPHELPWDFWRFPLAGLKLLFSQPTGFELVTAYEGLPAKLHSLVDDAPTRGISDYEVPLAVALIARKISDYDHEKLRWDVQLDAVLDSIYPNNTKPK